MKNVILSIVLCLIAQPVYAQSYRLVEKIRYSDDIETEIYIKAKKSNGTIITIPVINGMLPEIVEDRQEQEGVIYRDFIFGRCAVRYKGGLPIYRKGTCEDLAKTDAKQAAPIPMPIPEPKNIDTEERSVVVPPKKFELKKPSEIK